MKKTKTLIILFLFIAFTGCHEKSEPFINETEKPQIIPDYSGVTIPYNIAPLNFYIKEEAQKYELAIHSDSGDPIIVQQESPEFKIPEGKWKELLAKNKGNLLSFTISLKKDGQWHRYSSHINRIVPEPLTPWLVFRLIGTQYTYSGKMKLSQRNLESFSESVIFENTSTNEGCFNCHSFSNYDPEKMSIHFRQFYAGTFIRDGEDMKKLDTKTPFTMSAFGYVGWNPDGELIAYSTNIFNEYFTNSVTNLNEVTDQASDIVIYNVKSNMVTTSPKISTQNRENFPSWSPDGKWLYYLSAGKARDDFNSRFYGMYSLVRIEYDKKTNTWGEPDTLFNAEKENKSLTFPRISPDGKYLLFCLIDYGYFSINHQESDLYLMDLGSREFRKLSISSEYNDSYHSWSENGKWIAFSSKRFSNSYSAPWFSYYDDSGEFHKPFILPQKDPHFYETFTLNYNIPEFVRGKVDLNSRKIRDVLYQDAQKVTFDPTVDTDALSGATWIESHQTLK